MKNEWHVGDVGRLSRYKARGVTHDNTSSITGQKFLLDQYDFPQWFSKAYFNNHYQTD